MFVGDLMQYNLMSDYDGGVCMGHLDQYQCEYPHNRAPCVLKINGKPTMVFTYPDFSDPTGEALSMTREFLGELSKHEWRRVYDKPILIPGK